jgi:hypothetical protein
VFGFSDLGRDAALGPRVPRPKPLIHCRTSPGCLIEADRPFTDRLSACPISPCVLAVCHAQPEGLVSRGRDWPGRVLSNGGMATRRAPQGALQLFIHSPPGPVAPLPLPRQKKMPPSIPQLPETPPVLKFSLLLGLGSWRLWRSEYFLSLARILCHSGGQGGLP